MPAMLSRDFGSAAREAISDMLLSIDGTLPANFTAFSIWNIALSNSTEPRSPLPMRGSEMSFADAAPSGWLQSCW